VGGVDLYPVKARLFGPQRRLAVGPDRVGDIGMHHFAAACLLGAPFPRRGKDGLSRRLGARQDAAVGQLQDDSPAPVMHGLCHPGKPGDAFVAVDAQLPPHCKPLGLHVGVARNDEPHAACGKLPHEPDEFLRAVPVGRRKAFPCGGADKPVGELQGADPRGVKENRFAHATASCPGWDILLTRPLSLDMGNKASPGNSRR